MLHYSRLGWQVRNKLSSLFGPFASYEENEVLWIRLLISYSQHLIFSETYKWAQEARVLHNTKLEWLVRNKHFSLLGPFANYKENKVLWIRLMLLNLQHFIFFVTYKWAQYASVTLDYAEKKQAMGRHSSLSGIIISYKENEVWWIRSQRCSL